jgi:hypothetical protein
MATEHVLHCRRAIAHPSIDSWSLVSPMYVSREHPQQFMLIFAQLPSRRTMLQGPPAGISPYRLVLQAGQDGIAASVLVAHPDFGAE